MNTSAVMEEERCMHIQANIMDLPDEILEFILLFLSPYNDFSSAKCVCRRWHKVINGVIMQTFNNFRKSTASSSLEWTSQPVKSGPTITPRYSHSACYLQKSMYVFGGCTSSSTTFNDLWRFDLATREWIRPLAVGTYPSPKACASMVAYKDMLILFGGWSQPTPSPLHQTARFFDQLHIFSPKTNRWYQAITRFGPPSSAGHGATIVGDQMILFGGYHGIASIQDDQSAELWVLDLKDLSESSIQLRWCRKWVNGNKPRKRFGHWQIKVDDQHILVIGGYWGSNMQYTDVWLLTINNEECQWKELKVNGQENSPQQLRGHQACKVGDKVVVLSKNVKAEKIPISPKIEAQIKLSKPTYKSGNSSTQPVITQRNTFKRRLPDTSESSSQESSSDNDDVVTNAVRGISLNRGSGSRQTNRSPSKHNFQGLERFRHIQYGSHKAKASMILKNDSNSEQLMKCHKLELEAASYSPDNEMEDKCLGSSVMMASKDQSYDTERCNDLNLPSTQCKSSTCDNGTSKEGGACSPTQTSTETTMVKTIPEKSGTIQTSKPLCAKSVLCNHVCDKPCSSSVVNPGDVGLKGSHEEACGFDNSATSSTGNSTYTSDSKNSNLASAQSHTRTGLPSVRPNAMRDRQRQLETLKKYEDRIRNLSKPHSSPHCGQSSQSPKPNVQKASCNNSFKMPRETIHSTPQRRVQNPMYIHILDISEIKSQNCVTWTLIHEHTAIDAPEETIFYSLVEGRGELIMFGGIQSDLSSMQRGIQIKAQNANNTVHFIKPLQSLR